MQNPNAQRKEPLQVSYGLFAAFASVDRGSLP